MFVGFFLFAFSTLSFRHHNTIYRYTTLKKKSLFLMNISKEHCFVMHQWEGKRQGAPTAPRWPLRRELLGSIYI